MGSVFDDPRFNDLLFFPGGDATDPPPGAVDRMLPVDGAELHARWHVHPGSRALVVLFHGNGEVVADYDALAARYRDVVRADLAVIDFRGYGRSTGTPTFRDCIRDAAPALAALLAAPPAGARTTPLVVLGRSLGGACAAELAGRLPPVADAIVLESAASDPLGIVRRRGLRAEHPLDDATTAVFDPRPKLARCTLPALVLHGADDELIDAAEARANHALLTAAGSPTTLALVPHRGHNDLLSDPTYWDTLATFLDRAPLPGMSDKG